MTQNGKRGIPSAFDEDAKVLYGYPSLAYKPYLKMRDAWIESLDTPKGKVILDVGCSVGDALQNWTMDNTLVGLDRSEELLERARENGYSETIRTNFYTHNFLGRRFDGISAFGVVGAQEHLSTDFRRFHELLETGGSLYLILPLYGGIRKISRRLFRLVRRPGSMGEIPDFLGFETFLNRQGFEVDSFESSSMYFGGKISASKSWKQSKTAIYALVKAHKT